ncbi:PQQ-dependent catabolism-associated CXXCW motif protein [Alsobacter soli]|nr:PQQ-dependent catabolism-associated CXXCW motif protein [Alsobacter soli]
MLSLACASAYAQDGPPPEPEQYRMENYRAPTPATLRGARVLTTEEAAALWRSGSAAFIDVLPHPPKPQGLPPGTVWRDEPRQDIQGSIWLPDTGYGAIAAVTESYLRAGLERASGGDRSKLLVFYCMENCWMSWNAAKRALSLGYEKVAWYPEGTDGWKRANLPLQTARPEPRPGE